MEQLGFSLAWQLSNFESSWSAVSSEEKQDIRQQESVLAQVAKPHEE